MLVYRSLNGLRKSSCRTCVSLALWTSKVYCLFTTIMDLQTNSRGFLAKPNIPNDPCPSRNQSFTQNVSDLTFFNKLIFNYFKALRNIRLTEDILHQLIGNFFRSLSQSLRALIDLGRILAEFWPSTVAAIPSPQCGCFQK